MKALRSAAHTVLQECLRDGTFRIPRDARVELFVEEGSPFDHEHYRIRMTHRGKVDHHAAVEVSSADLQNERSAFRILEEKLGYLITLLFPTPTPKNFRRLRRRPIA